MNLRQAIKIAAKSIVGKKGRSVLTMLGIIIGLAAVIILVSFAQGQNKAMMDYYNSLGTNTINISAYTYDGRDITDQLYKYCQGMDEYLLGVTPNGQINSTVTITYGTKSASTEYRDGMDWNTMPQIMLGNQQYSLCNNYTIAKGRDLAYLDVKGLSQVCVLGYNMADQLFNYADPIGQTVNINGLPFTVIGTYDQVDAQGMMGKDQVVVLPYTVKRLLDKQSGFSDSSFTAKAKDKKSAQVATSLLNGYLKGLIPEGQGHGRAQATDQYKEEGEKQNQMQQMFLGGIAAISLLVGGIGIMNIMLVTVTERTREIGIRKAIGAERGSIISQFLIEACMICGLGGLIGIAIGWLGTVILCKVALNLIIFPNTGVTLGAFAFSVAMGVIFGLYPAVKASGLQPVEALRAD